MSLSFSRLSRNYLKMARPDVAQTFPRHVFLREPNHPSRFLTGTSELHVKQ